MSHGAETKGDRTRARVLDAALALFAERGFDETSMKDIAERAGIAVGASYRYFPSKESLIVGYYEQLSEELRLHADTLGQGRVSARYAELVRHKLGRLRPYRTALRGLVSVAMDPESDVGVLGASTARIRARNAATYLAVVRGAQDCPWESSVRPLARVLYTLDLALVFVWMVDRSPNQRATGKLIDLLESHLRFLPTTLMLPPVRSGLRDIEPILAELLDIPAELLFQEGDL